MVNDSTIDEKSAKYWCVFMDKDVAQLLEEAASHTEKEGKNLKKVLVQAEKKAERSKKLGEADWNAVQAMH